MPLSNNFAQKYFLKEHPMLKLVELKKGIRESLGLLRMLLYALVDFCVSCVFSYLLVYPWHVRMDLRGSSLDKFN